MTSAIRRRLPFLHNLPLEFYTWHVFNYVIAPSNLRMAWQSTALVNQSITAPMSGDTQLTIDNVVLNTLIAGKLPVGATFTMAAEALVLKRPMV